MVTRGVLPDGAIHLQSDRCSFTFRRPRPGVLLVTVVGYDDGAAGTAAVAEFTAETRRFGSLALFVDARQATGVAVTAGDACTAWFTANRDQLQQVHVLAPDRAVNLTFNVARHFSETDKLMRVYEEELRFREAIQRTVPEYAGPETTIPAG